MFSEETIRLIGLIEKRFTEKVIKKDIYGKTAQVSYVLDPDVEFLIGLIKYSETKENVKKILDNENP